MSSDHDIRICVPVKEETLPALIAEAKKATSWADIIELRIDALEHGAAERAKTQLAGLITSIAQPVILTFRPSEQGGYRNLSKDDRLAFWQTVFDSKAVFFDLEYDLVTELINYDAERQPDWSRVICSHHDFEKVPADLEEIYERLAFTPASILKLAVRANEITDCLQIFRLLRRAHDEERELIAIGMDDAGLITRILGPSRGSFLTYGAFDSDRGTAPGQLVASTLRSVYRIDSINSETMITGLVGLPVSHSVSPHLHNASFEAANIDGVYLPFHVSHLPNFVRRMVHPRSRELDWNLKGLSITAPHKTAMLNLLDWVEPTAQKIGAVNTVVIENEQLLGYNTDAQGLIEPLQRQFGALSGARVAVLGAGGAASAAVYALQRSNAKITLYARNLDKAQRVSQRFNISYKSLDSSTFADNDIVINATPLGSSGPHINETPVVAEQLRGVSLVYDLVYNPIQTVLLSEARSAGCEVLGGLEMLVAQAALQFKLWTNMQASSKLMYNAGASALNESSVRS